MFFKGRNIVLIPLTLFITAFLFLLGPLSHKSISISSQTAKINRLLTELKLVKNGKLLVYKDNPKTDSLMGELYSATRYLNRNYQKTGLEPYLKYPTEAEIQKQTYIEKASTSPGSTNRNQIMDRYDRRQDIRQILSDDLEKFNIHSYDSDRETATSTWFEIESQIPQNLIPAGNWTHYYPIEDIYMNEDYESTVSSRPDFIKIKRNKGATNGDVGSNVTLIVNGEEIEIPIQNALASDLKNRMRSAEFNILKVPNNKLLFPFKKNGQEGIFVVEKINYDVFETNGANPNNLKIDRITGCIFMK